MTNVQPLLASLSVFTNKGVGQPSIAPRLRWVATRIGPEIGCGVV
jgi:hypothetical protein